MADKPKSEDAAPAKKGGGMAAVLILVAAAGITSFATMYLMPGESSATVAQCEPVEAHEPSIAPIWNESQYYVELEEILVTIGSAPTGKYLKMSVSIITDNAHAREVEDAGPVLIDAFTAYLRSVELSDFEDPGFYGHLRGQLSRRSELVLGGSASNGVLITEFLIR